MVLSTTQQNKKKEENTTQQHCLGTFRSLPQSEVSLDIGIVYAKIVIGSAATILPTVCQAFKQGPLAQGDIVPWDLKSKHVFRFFLCVCVWLREKKKNKGRSICYFYQWKIDFDS